MAAEPSSPASIIPFVNLNVAAAKVFRLKVQGYSSVRSMARDPGGHYESDAISVGGYDWAVCYYPFVFDIYLVLLQPNKIPDDIAVSFSCTLLEKSGEPSVEMEQVSSDIISGGSGDDRSEVIGFFFNDEAAEKFVVGNSIVLQCTISVLKKPTKSLLVARQTV
ncbi:unnamed protein product [Urochloa humidicola]